MNDTPPYDDDTLRRVLDSLAHRHSHGPTWKHQDGECQHEHRSDGVVVDACDRYAIAGTGYCEEHALQRWLRGELTVNGVVVPR